MAGIVGYIGREFANQEPDLIFSMSESIRYVGSDIIDQWNDRYYFVSRVHHGLINAERQPIYNEDKSLNIIFDGEIFDYESEKKYLESHGHRFKYKKSDAEFVLHLFEEFGDDAFTKLNGSFLIFIYNAFSNELTIANDRFASCPLFYYVNKKYLVFGAQMKAILQSDRIPRRLNLKAVSEFFCFQKIIGAKTYYKDIKMLLPASIVKYNKNIIKIWKYWHPDYRKSDNRPENHYVVKLADAIQKAVYKRTKDKYRFGILLSGGLDSRTILAASKRAMTAFTLADFENREVAIAKKVASSINCQHIFLKRNLDYYPNIAEIGMELGDGMWSFWHAHFTGFIDEIRKNCDIVFYGLFFDTLFKGAYLPKKKIIIGNKQISLPTLAKLKKGELIDAHLRSFSSLWDNNPKFVFNKKLRKNINTDIKIEIENIINKSLNYTENYYDTFEYMESHCFFRSFGFLNRLCINHYINDRVVAYDNNLLDLHLEMPYHMRLNGRVFIKALNKLNPKIADIPNANTGLSPKRSPYLELAVFICNRIKRLGLTESKSKQFFTHGSWPNMHELIRCNKNLQHLIWDVINDENSVSSDIFCRTKLIEMFNRHMDHQNNYTWFLFLILTFGMWFKKYGPN